MAFALSAPPSSPRTLPALLGRLLFLVIPVLVLAQARILAWLSTAQWLGWLNLSRCNVLWTVLPPIAEHRPPSSPKSSQDEELKEEAAERGGGGPRQSLHELFETLKAMSIPGFRVLDSWCDASRDRARLRAWYVTPWLKWVEVVTIDLHRTQGRERRRDGNKNRDLA